MKISKNISSFIGFIAYKYLVLFFSICLTLGVSLIMISVVIKDFFPYWYILSFFGFFFIALFLIGMTNSYTDNYRVALSIAKNLYEEISDSNLTLRITILNKLSQLMEKTNATKNSTQLYVWVTKIEHYKKNSDGIANLEKTLKTGPEKIDGLKDEIGKFQSYLYEH